MPNETHSAIKFGKVFSIWWIVWAVLHAVILSSLDFNFRVCFSDSFVATFLTSGGCLLVVHIMRFYLPQKERYWYILAVSIFLSLFLVFVGKSILTIVNSGDLSYIIWLRKTVSVRFVITFLLIGCMSILSLSWYSYLDQKEKEQRQADMEKLSKESELLKIRQQLQPHFLFNSLNSISALVGTRPEEARRMIQQLSDFLRGTIKKEDHQFVTLEEELQHLQLYLDIEQVRFGHRLSTVVEKDETMNQMKLPSLLLQPIVENAIKFGLYDTIETVVISIDVKKENGQLIIIVKNPFDSQTAVRQKGSGFGLSSIQRRLYLLYARRDLLVTDATNNIFTTTLKIPQST